jgi:hypothetical protein
LIKTPITGKKTNIRELLKNDSLLKKHHDTWRQGIFQALSLKNFHNREASTEDMKSLIQSPIRANIYDLKSLKKKIEYYLKSFLADNNKRLHKDFELKKCTAVW